MKVKSRIEPVAIGTRKATPSNFPLISGMALAVAMAAPVLVGMILRPAVLPRRKSLCGPSTIF